jgi:hypothetical protein
MLKYEYTFYLPQYVADNHGHPTGVMNIEAMSEFLDALGNICGGYTGLEMDACGAWYSEDWIIRDRLGIVLCTMDRAVFEEKIVPELRKFKHAMNQQTVYVTATQVEVCCV